jgi:hypothetical protein
VAKVIKNPASFTASRVGEIAILSGSFTRWPPVDAVEGLTADVDRMNPHRTRPPESATEDGALKRPPWLANPSSLCSCRFSYKTRIIYWRSRAQAREKNKKIENNYKLSHGHAMIYPDGLM